MAEPVNIDEIEGLGRERLDPAVLAYVEGGALDGISLAEAGEGFGGGG